MAQVLRIALVSPYSYTYPGGVGRHVEATAEELIRRGHDVRMFAPYDPDDRLARAMHRGARPDAREVPDYLVPLGRTIGIPANGAVSNLSFTPYATSVLGRAVRDTSFDVIHVHEPNAPVVEATDPLGAALEQAARLMATAAAPTASSVTLCEALSRAAPVLCPGLVALAVCGRVIRPPSIVDNVALRPRQPGVWPGWRPVTQLGARA